MGPRPLRFESLEDRRLLATFTVTNLIDGPVVAAGQLPGSLRQAIFDANSAAGADTIEFDVVPGTLALTAGEFAITEALTIDGPGSELLTINAGFVSRHFNITAITGDFGIEGLTLINGRLNNNNVSAADNTYSGGSIRSLTAGNLQLVDMSITASELNGSFANGGGVVAIGDVMIADSSISGSAIGINGRGGGIYTAGNLTSNRSSVRGTSYADGGGAYAVGNVTIANSNFSNSSALLGSGGGIYSEGDVLIANSKIHENSARGPGATGGGVFAGGNLEITSTSVYRNRMLNGGDGGGIAANGNAMITNVMFTLNEVIGGRGGGLYVAGNAEVQNSTFYQNRVTTALGVGGGISVGGGAEITNSVFRNTGIAPSSNPDIHIATGSLALHYSIIANNAGTTLVEAPVGSPDANGNLVGGPINGIIDPKYTTIPLEDPSIYVLEPTSPAINAGDPTFNSNEFDPPLTTDWRGGPFVRVSGGRIDMGAFEYQPGSLVVDTLEFEDDLDYTHGKLSLLEAVQLAGQNPGFNTISFDPSLFADGPQVIDGADTDLYLNDSAMILGPGRELLTIISGGIRGSVISSTLSIQNLSLQGGSVSAKDLVTIDNVTIRNGGIDADDVVMQNCVVEDSPSNGVRAVYSAQVRNSQIRRSAGLGILLVAFDGSTTEINVEVEDCIIEDNLKGGMFISDVGQNVNSSITIRNSIVRGNQSESNGHAAGIFAFLATTAAILIVNTEISNNVFTGVSGDSQSLGTGGIRIAFAGLSIYDSEIIGNTGHGLTSAGGVSASWILAENCVFSNNQIAAEFPSGAAILSGDLELRNCVVENNSGAPAIFASTMTATSSTIHNNTNNSGIGGGGIEAGVATLIRTNLTGNHTAEWGGGISAREATIVDSIIAGNSASGDPAATPIAFESDSIYVVDGGGGGIHIAGIPRESLPAGQLLLENSVVTDNSVTGLGSGGGGILLYFATATIKNSTIVDNWTTSEEVTYLISTDPPLGLSFQRDGSGGGIHIRSKAEWLYDAPAVIPIATESIIINSTITSNRIEGRGAGAGVYAFGDVDVSHSTVAFNVTQDGAGGGIYVNAADVFDLTLRNSIVAGNSATNFAPDLRPGTGTNAINYSLIGNTSGSTITSGTGTGNILNQDPQLLPLANNGGPTPTHALAATSPAVNAGNPSAMVGQNGVPVTDQRGVPFTRIFGGRIDMGAYERGVQNWVVDTLTDVTDGDYSAGELSLREAIGLANGNLGFVDNITFAEGLSGTIRLEQGELEATEALNITGPGADLITVDAQQNSRVMRLFAFSGEFAISGLTLTGGKVDFESVVFSPVGGAIVSYTADQLSLDAMVITGNRAEGQDARGGGVYSVGDLVISNSTVSDNITTGHDDSRGGAGIAGQQNVSVFNSTISGNRATGLFANGGGLLVYGDLNVFQSTISGNRVEGLGGYGGGAVGAGETTISYSTVTDNHALGEFGKGGGLYVPDSEVLRLRHSIVSGNTATVGNNDITTFVYSATTTAIYSIVGDRSGTTLAESPVGQADASGNWIGGPTNGFFNAMLGPLADNGGQTKTHLALPGSVAIDGGAPFAIPGGGGVDDTPFHDQRGEGYTRFFDTIGVEAPRIDIGATELQLRGDYNRDGFVDAADYTVWRNAFGQTDLVSYSGADGSGNGSVGPEDYTVWKKNFGESLPVGGGAAASFAANDSVSDERTEPVRVSSSAGPEVEQQPLVQRVFVASETGTRGVLLPTGRSETPRALEIESDRLPVDTRVADVALSVWFASRREERRLVTFKSPLELEGRAPAEFESSADGVFERLGELADVELV